MWDHSKCAEQLRRIPEVTTVPSHLRTIFLTSLLGVFWNMSKAKNQPFCTTKEHFQEKAWTMMNGKVILFEEPMGRMLTAKTFTSSQTQSSALAQVYWMQAVRPLFGKRRNRSDIAGQAIDIAWHVCPGANAEKKNSKHSCRRLGTIPKAFRTGSILRACSTTSPTGKVGRCKINVQLKRMKWLLTQQESDLVIGVSVSRTRKDLDM